MPILFNQKTKEFHLYNSEISYILNIMKNNHLEFFDLCGDTKDNLFEEVVRFWEFGKKYR